MNEPIAMNNKFLKTKSEMCVWFRFLLRCLSLLRSRLCANEKWFFGVFHRYRVFHRRPQSAQVESSMKYRTTPTLRVCVCVCSSDLDTGSRGYRTAELYKYATREEREKKTIKKTVCAHCTSAMCQKSNNIQSTTRKSIVFAEHKTKNKSGDHSICVHIFFTHKNAHLLIFIFD